MRRFKSSELKAISEIPLDGGSEWLIGAEDSVKFLKVNALNDEIVIYASAPAVLIHGVLAPTDKVTPPDGDDLQHAMFPMVDDSWAIQRVWGGGQGHRMYLEPPFGSSGSKSFNGGEKLIFRRSFDGVKDAPAPIELSQKLVHSLDLHFVAERSAYCRLDPRGDIEDVIRIVQLDVTNTWEGREVVTILRKDLDAYMALSNTSLVLRFDFTRVRHSSFDGWGDHDRIDKQELDLFYHGGSNGRASYLNGAMIVRPQVTVDDLVQEWKDKENPKSREYATFKIFDRKNNLNVETSCGPEFLSNYFQQSDLPWEISPAFFRPEVLHRFKADAEKYTLEDRSISCRNAWYLKTYDINEAGQVHTYIGYLAGLPIEEQRYWQAFNEWPKDTISKRAHQTDILGEWSTDYDPLNSIKHVILKLDATPREWWKPRGDALANAVRYPATDSPLEWANEIMALDQFLVEGFQSKPLRALAEAKGRKLDPSWQSLKIMQEVLVAIGRTKEDAEVVMLPLRKLHAMRNPLKGHGSTLERKKAEVDARTEFGTFRAHFTQLAADCDKALRSILEALDIDLKLPVL